MRMEIYCKELLRHPLFVNKIFKIYIFKHLIILKCYIYVIIPVLLVLSLFLIIVLFNEVDKPPHCREIRRIEVYRKCQEKLISLINQNVSCSPVTRQELLCEQQR